MKTMFLTIIALVLVTGASFGQNPMTKKDSLKAAKNAPYVLFEKVEHDFSTIPFNGDGTYEFSFKNTGKTPLILQNCQSSCGCTVPEWPKEPIKKGGTGKIKVKYNTNRAGNFHKTVTVYSNASNNPVVLTIKGNVNKEEEKLNGLPVKDQGAPANTNEIPK